MNRQYKSGHRGDGASGRARPGALPWQQPRLPSQPSLPAAERIRSERGVFAGTVVTVVVPTCGRPALLNRCLAALTAQTLDSMSYEIIVVDDAASAQTQSLTTNWAARTLGRGPMIGYIANRGPHGPAAARNLGWRAACGEVIAFTDDDTVPDADWLRSGLQAFTLGVHAVSGRIVMPISDRPTDYERDAKQLEQSELVTANCFCLKSVLDEVDGFDTRFRSAWREDSDLHFRLLARKARIVHVPEAVVVHPVRPAPWGVSLLQQKKILYDALLYKKHPKLYREKIRASARWDYYAITACLAAIPAALAAGMPLAAALAGAVWATMTGAFCASRLRGTSRAPRHVAEMVVTSALIPPVSVFWRLVGAIRFRAPLI